MNKAYLNQKELIITTIEDGWYDEVNSIILIEDIKPHELPTKQVITNSYFVKIKHSGKLMLGVKYTVEVIVSYFDIKETNKISINYSGESVTDYLGPRDIFIFKDPAEKIWGKTTKEYKYKNHDIEMYFQKSKGWTRQNISSKNGETIHYSITIMVSNVSNVNEFINLIRMHHDFIFGFQWLENEKIAFGYGGMTINPIYFNEDATINHSTINNLKPYYLGNAGFMKSSNIELFMSTYNFINIIRDNHFFEIKINILSTIVEMLFDKFYLTKYNNGKNIQNLSSKLKRIMPINAKKSTEDIVDDFKNARDSISHWLNKEYNKEKAQNAIDNIIWLWCYFINGVNPEMAISRIFPKHNNSKLKNNYSLYEKTKIRLEKINKNNLINYIYSTWDDFKDTRWEKEVSNMLEDSPINNYNFIHPNGYHQILKISDENKNSNFLIELEQQKVDFAQDNISIKYADIIKLSESKIKNARLFLEKIIEMIQPPFK